MVLRLPPSSADTPLPWGLLVKTTRAVLPSRQPELVHPHATATSEHRKSPWHRLDTLLGHAASLQRAGAAPGVTREWPMDMIAI